MSRWKLPRKRATPPAENGPRLEAATLELAEREQQQQVVMTTLDRASANQLLGLQAALEEMALLSTVAQETRTEAPPSPRGNPLPAKAPVIQPGEVTEAGTAKLIRISGEIEALIEDLPGEPAGGPAGEAIDAIRATPLPAASSAAFEILHPRCPSKWSEAFRKLRGRILEERTRREADGRRLNSIAVVSPRRSGGRSATARNLAACLSAIPEARVLLVDADLGRPSVHRRLRIAQSPGLTDAIEARKSNWGDYVHQLPGSGLHILPLGAAATGIDGLDLARLPDFLECAAGVFQWIVIDAPPMDSADGEALASMADGTVLVLRREREYFDEANAAVRRIDPARLLGAVLNFS